MTPSIRTTPRQAVPGVHLHYSAARFTRLFLTVAGSLWIVHILLHLVAVATGNDRLGGLVYIFGLGAEQNLPTLYSSVALLVVAGLLFVTARHSKTDRVYWWVLGFAFVFLAIDETCEIHEKLINPLKERLHTSGVFHYAWVIPYGIASLVFGLAFLRFLLRLPRRTAWRFVIGGAVFVTGAIGMEMVGGKLFEDGGTKQWGYWSVQTLEEVFEMTGVLVFLFGLGDYINSNLGGLTIRIGSEADAPSGTQAPTQEPALAQPRAVAKTRTDVAS
ncbi:MAG TPA: hypothetical protein VFD82_09435 [Planctomycetota bacterium]|nr:hypothetical protein [Planctomycetota bacterium]